MDPNNLRKQMTGVSAHHPSPPLVETFEWQWQQHDIPDSQNNVGYAVHLDKAQKEKNSTHSVTAS